MVWSAHSRATALTCVFGPQCLKAAKRFQGKTKEGQQLELVKMGQVNPSRASQTPVIGQSKPSYRGSQARRDQYILCEYRTWHSTGLARHQNTRC